MILDDPLKGGHVRPVDATFGAAMLWTTLLTISLMTAVQEICDRIGLATRTASLLC